MEVLWLLHTLNPEIPALAPVVVHGLKHTEQVIHALVEIVHAFNSCDTYSNITIGVYLQLLLSKDPLIAFSAKQALNKVLKPKSRRRRVYIPSPPHCVSQPVKNIDSDTGKCHTKTKNIEGKHFEMASRVSIYMMNVKMNFIIVFILRCVVIK